MEDFHTGDAPGLFPLALATGRVELERVGHSVLRLARDHAVGEVSGRQRFAAREFRGEAGDPPHAVVGGTDETIAVVVFVFLGRPARGRAGAFEAGGPRRLGQAVRVGVVDVGTAGAFATRRRFLGFGPPAGLFLGLADAHSRAFR